LYAVSLTHLCPLPFPKQNYTLYDDLHLILVFIINAETKENVMLIYGCGQCSILLYSRHHEFLHHVPRNAIAASLLYYTMRFKLKFHFGFFVALLGDSVAVSFCSPELPLPLPLPLFPALLAVALGGAGGTGVTVEAGAGARVAAGRGVAVNGIGVAPPRPCPIGTVTTVVAGDVFVPGAGDDIGATVGGVLPLEADAETDGGLGVRVVSNEAVALSIVGRLVIVGVTVIVTVTIAVLPGIAFAGSSGGTTMMIGGATVVIGGGGMTDGEDTGGNGTDGTGVPPAGVMPAPLVAVALGWAGWAGKAGRADGVSKAGVADVAGVPDEVSGVPIAAEGVATGTGVCAAIGESAVGVGAPITAGGVDPPVAVVGAPTDAPPAVTGMAAVAGVAGTVGVSSVGGVAVGIVGKAKGGDVVGNPTARWNPVTTG